MAGLIAFGDTKEEHWHAANWAFWYLLDGVVPALSADDELRRRIDKVKESRFEYLELDDLTAKDLERLAGAVRSHRDALEDHGPSSFASPEFFLGYLERVEQLLSAISEAIARWTARDS